MSISIAQIVDTAILRTRFLAGHRGGSRSVAWAHTCELPDPWNWLGERELLMSDGYNFPAAAAEQVAFLEKLDSSQFSGLSLAAGVGAPRLTREAIDAADALAFPVLETAYEIPFVAIARVVAERNSKASVASLTKILGVYDRLHRSDRSPMRRDLLDQLAIEAGARLHVIDVSTGRIRLESRTRLPESVSLEVLEAIKRRQGPLAGYTRIAIGEERLVVIPLPLSGAVLVAEPLRENDVLELHLLQHIASIAELEITRHAQDEESSRAASAELFTRILDGDLGGEGAEARLEIAGFRPGVRHVLAIRSAGRTAALHKHLFHDGVTCLLVNRAGLDLVLTDSPGEVLDRIDYDTSNDSVGVSLPLSTTDRLPDAVREARWALEAAVSLGASVVTYGDYSDPFLPRTLEEARLVVDQVLGPVISHDLRENSELLRTLETFFSADRSWQITAQQLRVHKQTVVYRIHQIETLTGRTIRRLSDQTDLFLAIRARNLLEV